MHAIDSTRPRPQGSWAETSRLAARDRQRVEGAPLFAAMAPAARDEVLDQCRMLMLAPQDTLFGEGAPAAFFYLIDRGLVQLYREVADRRAVIYVARPGETIGEPSSLMVGHYCVTAEAVSETRVLEVPVDAFRAAISGDPAGAFAMIETLSGRLLDAWRAIEDHQLASTSVRLGGYLLRLSESCEDKNAFDLPFDKALLAGVLGMQPESLSRAFAKLRPYGIESHGRHIVINDRQRLIDYCAADNIH